MPRYGTCVIFRPPAARMNISTARCGVAPMPVEPNDSWPGRSLMYCTSSFIECTGSDGLHHQHEGHRRGERDRREVLRRIVGQLLVERRVGGERAGRHEEQRVAVGRRLGDRGRGDHRAAAGAVFNDDRLAEPLFQLRLELPARHDVHRAARPERQDQRDRPRRIVVGAGRRRLRQEKRRRRAPRASAQQAWSILPSGILDRRAGRAAFRSDKA